MAATALALALAAMLVGCADFFPSGRDVVAVSVTPANSTIQPGATQQFTAKAQMGDSTSQDVTTQATWTSSSAGVATISSAGLASASTAGSTTISANFQGKTGSTTLTVGTTTKPITSIAVTPANPSISAGQTQQFTATATFNDNTTGDVTNSVTWSSSNTGVATISSSGIATAVAAGTTTITATSGTVSGTASLTVM